MYMECTTMKLLKNIKKMSIKWYRLISGDIFQLKKQRINAYRMLPFM